MKKYGKRSCSNIMRSGGIERGNAGGYSVAPARQLMELGRNARSLLSGAGEIRAMSNNRFQADICRQGHGWA